MKENIKFWTENINVYVNFTEEGYDKTVSKFFCSCTYHSTASALESTLNALHLSDQQELIESL